MGGYVAGAAAVGNPQVWGLPAKFDRVESRRTFSNAPCCTMVKHAGVGPISERAVNLERVHSGHSASGLAIIYLPQMRRKESAPLLPACGEARKSKRRWTSGRLGTTAPSFGWIAT